MIILLIKICQNLCKVINQKCEFCYSNKYYFLRLFILMKIYLFTNKIYPQKFRYPFIHYYYLISFLQSLFLRLLNHLATLNLLKIRYPLNLKINLLIFDYNFFFNLLFFK